MSFPFAKFMAETSTTKNRLNMKKAPKFISYIDKFYKAREDFEMNTQRYRENFLWAVIQKYD